RGWIYSIGVAPSERRHGHGRALLTYVETQLRELGCPKINIQVLAVNEEALHFWRAAGYQPDHVVGLGRRLERYVIRGDGSSERGVIRSEARDLDRCRVEIPRFARNDNYFDASPRYAARTFGSCSISLALPDSVISPESIT